VSSVSANKLLGHLGLELEIPTIGFQLRQNLHGTLVLLISHTGGTFATVSTANLLRDVTPNLFVLTDTWDTLLARTVLTPKPSERHGTKNFLQSTFARARVFTTRLGPRPAEPATVTVAATHQLLTQLLLHLMQYVADSKMGVSYSKGEVAELCRLNADSLSTLAQIVDGTSTVHTALVAQGRRWAQHVLESPKSWILSATYILVTVVLATTPLSLLTALIGDALTSDVRSDEDLAAASVEARCAHADANATVAKACAVQWALAYSASDGAGLPAAVPYMIGAIDALIYIFLPIWTTWILRLVERRPLLHRVAGRTLVIGDVPWVAQSLEAYTSKLYALSYSIASITVLSGNPVDHFVHRHTHRVVRGALVAVGRPDGRLSSLSSADAAICLATSQASSIQNFGVTCESITIGHNPAGVSLTQNDIVLPTVRPLFLTEAMLMFKVGSSAALKGTSGSLIGAMSDAKTGESKMGSADFRDAMSRVLEEEQQSCCKGHAEGHANGHTHGHHAPHATAEMASHIDDLIARDSPLPGRRCSFSGAVPLAAARFARRSKEALRHSKERMGTSPMDQRANGEASEPGTPELSTTSTTSTFVEPMPSTADERPSLGSRRRSADESSLSPTLNPTQGSRRRSADVETTLSPSLLGNRRSSFSSAVPTAAARFARRSKEALRHSKERMGDGTGTSRDESSLDASPEHKRERRGSLRERRGSFSERLGMPKPKPKPLAKRIGLSLEEVDKLQSQSVNSHSSHSSVFPPTPFSASAH
jgi:hypothetical protein